METTTMRAATVLRAALALLALAIAGSATARPLDEVTGSGTLRVVAYLDNKPFSWEAENGEARGIDVDLARAIASELGVKAEVVLRMQGEKADDDLRGNVWRGPLTGGGVGDIMMHVPIDREFSARNSEAVIGNPYFEERVAVAVDAARIPEIPSFDLFKSEKIAVQLGTVADYFLMTHADGALIENVNHYVKPPDGAKLFANGDIPALMGVRSHIEGLLHEAGVKATILEPPMPTIVRSRWLVGMAVNEKSRDLRDAVGQALVSLRTSGKLEDIFARYGVSYTPPGAY
jgi:polar amino acid transport system substrate-binding protein